MPRCEPTSPFGQAVPVTGLPDVVGVWLTPTEDLIYYGDNTQLFTASRTAPTAFGPGVPVVVDIGDASASGRPSRPSLSDDRRTLFFERDFSIWRATGEPGGPYTNVTRIGESMGQPYLDAVHGALYASRYLEAGTFYRGIARADVSAGAVGSFAPLPFGDASTHNPVPGVDGNSLFFAAIVAQLRDDDILHARLDAGSGEVVPNIGSAKTDAPEWLSRDGCHLYISSNRESGFGSRLYLAVRGR